MRGSTARGEGEGGRGDLVGGGDGREREERERERVGWAFRRQGLVFHSRMRPLVSMEIAEVTGGGE